MNKMGIQLEFNPDLALRRFGTKGRIVEECLPGRLESGKIYRFLKRGQRNYWLEGEIPLLETEGGGVLSRPVASVKIIQYTCCLLEDRVICTKGVYEVIEVFDINDNKINFEGYERR